MNGSIPVYAEDGVTVLRRHSPYAPKALAKYAESLKKRKVIDRELDYNAALKAALIHAIVNTPTLGEAADEIGIARVTLFRWAKKWGIKVER